MIKASKWKWAGHVSRAKNNWTSDIIKWNPKGKKRGRPKTRWTIDLVKYIGNIGTEMAEDWKLWSSKRDLRPAVEHRRLTMIMTTERHECMGMIG